MVGYLQSENAEFKESIAKNNQLSVKLQADMRTTNCKVKQVTKQTTPAAAVTKVFDPADALFFKKLIANQQPHCHHQPLEKIPRITLQLTMDTLPKKKYASRPVQQKYVPYIFATAQVFQSPACW